MTASHDGWSLKLIKSVELKPQQMNVSWTSFLRSFDTRFHPSSANCFCWSEFTAKQDEAMENCNINNKNRIIMYYFGQNMWVEEFLNVQAFWYVKMNYLLVNGCVFFLKDTKNRVTWWCLTAPASPINEINIRMTPQARIPPIIGKFITMEAVRP